MANYAKRDARKAWVADMAANRGKQIEPDVPRCHCGAIAVIEVSLSTGTRYFCEAHRGEGERLFARRK